jgi:neutral ceramidase
LPLFGFSIAAKVGQGYRTRLYARAIYLEDAKGGRLALVQCDIGAISSLLHRRVAARIVEATGISADRLLIAATHTHSAPGAYFGSAIYNLLGSARVGFDQRMLDMLVERISDAVIAAHDSAAPAKLAIGEIAIPGVTHNRSFEAYKANKTPSLAANLADAIHKLLTMIRVDRNDGATSRPLGAFSIFSIHGTAVPYNVDLYSGDSFAAAERVLEAKIKKRYRVNENEDVVHAMVSGPAGDVSPNYSVQSFDAAHDLGNTIADSAFALFTSLDRELRSDIFLQHQFIEIDLQRGHRVNGRPLSRRAVYGDAAMHGTEDGGPGSFLADLLFGREGARLAIKEGVQTWKKPGLGNFQRLFPAVDFPTTMTLQVLQIGNLLLPTIPGEMTTEMGHRVKEACLASAKLALPSVQKTAVVCLANQYMSYITTPEEYSQQHYEGGSNLYGENTGPFVQEQLVRLIEKIGKGETPALKNHWTFAPGLKWRFIKKKKTENVQRKEKELSKNRCSASFSWIDLPRSALDFGEILVRIEVEDAAGIWQPFVKDDMHVDDRGLEIEVRSLGKDDNGWLWRAAWLPACPAPAGTFRFVILERTGQLPLYSDSFSF